MGKKNLNSITIRDEKVLPAKENDSPLMKKPKREPDSEVVSIKITASELAAIKSKKDPLVPLSTYVKHYLRTKTDLLVK